MTASYRFSRTLPVHDFYARVLGVYGGRRAYLARLGTEVSDILDEFLSFALAFETAGMPGLQAFVSTLETEAPEVKREQDKDRDEVRIMTVHASKGLEAPIVFLVDGGGKAFNPQSPRQVSHDRDRRRHTALADLGAGARGSQTR